MILPAFLLKLLVALIEKGGKVKVIHFFQETFSSQRGDLDDVTNEVARLRADLQRLKAESKRVLGAINAKMATLPWFGSVKTAPCRAHFYFGLTPGYFIYLKTKVLNI